MSTFGIMKARIADEMKRGDITACATSVTNAVLDAIKYWERKRFDFNQARDSSKLTTSGSAFLSSVPTGILKIDSLLLTTPGGYNYELAPTSHEAVAGIDTGNFTGYPEQYAWYTPAVTAVTSIRLYPVPNGAYTATFSFIRRLPEISETATANTTNAWMVEAEALIRNWAKGLLFDHQLRAPERADRMYTLAGNEYRPLRREANWKRATGRTTPTRF